MLKSAHPLSVYHLGRREAKARGSAISANQWNKALALASGAVQWKLWRDEGGEWRCYGSVRADGSAPLYQTTIRTCTCRKSQFGGGWCSHRVAVWMREMLERRCAEHRTAQTRANEEAARQATVLLYGVE